MANYSAYRYDNLRDPDGIANEIIFTRKHPGNDLLSFLIVEGDTDRKFYKTFVDKEKCHITVAYNKFSILQVISILAKDGFPGVLAIVDADFDVLEGKLPANPSVLFTDTHDLETMMIQSPAFEKVLSEFGSEEKITQFIQKTGKDVRAIVLEAGVSMGYLRWISLQEKLNLTFEGLDFTRFLDKNTLVLDLLKLLQTVKNKSQKPGITEAQLHTGIQNMRDATHDPWHICCGHDLVSVLCVGLHKAIGTHNNNAHEIHPENLERSLRLAFERAHFYNTHLYISIQQWEIAHHPFVILARG